MEREGKGRERGEEGRKGGKGRGKEEGRGEGRGEGEMVPPHFLAQSDAYACIDTPAAWPMVGSRVWLT